MYGSTSTPSLTSDTLESNSSNSNNSSDTQSFTKSQIEDLEKSLEFFPRNHEEDEFDYVTSPTIVRFNYKQRLMKCFLSMCLWFVSYYVMAMFGGAVAYMHFPRYPEQYPVSLPDYAFDIIPEFCPRMGILMHDNIQSEVLLILYLYIAVYCLIRTKKTNLNDVHGLTIFQQLLHLNVLVFLTRTTTVSLTGIPQPNPRCVRRQHEAMKYKEAFHLVVMRGFPPHACGDLMYSGHVACTLMCVILILKHRLYENRFMKYMVLCLAGLGMYAVLSCRSHYSMDVVVAIYFALGLSYFYFTIRENPNFFWIKWLDSM